MKQIKTTFSPARLGILFFCLMFFVNMVKAECDETAAIENPDSQDEKKEEKLSLIGSPTKNIVEALLQLHPSSAEVDHFIALYLHLGLVDHAQKVLEGYYSNQQKPKTPTSYWLEAKIAILKMQLGGQVKLLKCQTPSVALKNDIKKLNKAEEAIKRGLKKLKEYLETTKIKPEAYVQLRLKLILTEATIYLNQGDLSYKIEGASLFNQLDKKENKNAGARYYYNRARNKAYEATMIKHSNDTAVLADKIDQRLQWLNQNLFFGGLRYFQMETVVGSESSESWTLKGQIETIFNGHINRHGAKNTLKEKEKAWIDKLKESNKLTDRMEAALNDKNKLIEQRQATNLENFNKEIDALKIKLKASGVGQQETIQRLIYEAELSSHTQGTNKELLNLRKDGYKKQIIALNKETFAIDTELDMIGSCKALKAIIPNVFDDSSNQSNASNVKNKLLQCASTTEGKLSEIINAYKSQKLSHLLQLLHLHLFHLILEF